MLAVALRDNRPVGLIVMNIGNEKAINLFMVGVLPDYQRRGVGTDLLMAVSKKYGKNYEILVETSSRNIAACKLYQNMGFELYATRYILHYMR